MQELGGELDQETGSMHYVNQRLSVILNTEPKPTFLGAIILDAVMNYNGHRNSQVMPYGFNEVFESKVSRPIILNGQFLN